MTEDEKVENTLMAQAIINDAIKKYYERCERKAMTPRQEIILSVAAKADRLIIQDYYDQDSGALVQLGYLKADSTTVWITELGRQKLRHE